MRCKDCAYKTKCGAHSWKCGQAQSTRAGQNILPYPGEYGTGCDWRDGDRLLPPLYHVATEEQVASIRHAGLLPAISERSSEANETAPAVYFFRSPEDVENAMMNWLGESLPENSKLYMLTAELPDAYAPVLANTAGYETACYAPVPPDYLDFQDFNEWHGWALRKGALAHAPA